MLAQLSDTVRSCNRHDVVAVKAHLERSNAALYLCQKHVECWNTFVVLVIVGIYGSDRKRSVLHGRALPRTVLPLHPTALNNSHVIGHYCASDS